MHPHKFFSAAAEFFVEKKEKQFPVAEEPSSIDLNEQLIRNPSATYFMRVHSQAMAEAGIHPGDMVIVDRSIEASNGRIIIALVGEEMLIRRLEISNGRKRLVPATQKLSPIDLDPSACSIWGVVTFVIHSL